MNTEAWQVDNYRHCERCDGPMFMTGPDNVGPILCDECAKVKQEIGDQPTWECNNCEFHLPCSAFFIHPDDDLSLLVCCDCHAIAVELNKGWRN